MKRIPGPNDASAPPALADAMRRLREGKRGAPSADYPLRNGVGV